MIGRSLNNVSSTRISFREIASTGEGHDSPKSREESSLQPGSKTMPTKRWTQEQIENVHITHRKPEGFIDHFAYWTIQTIRFNFDIISGYAIFPKTEKTWLNRIVFLEVCFL